MTIEDSLFPHDYPGSVDWFLRERLRLLEERIKELEKEVKIIKEHWIVVEKDG